MSETGTERSRRRDQVRRRVLLQMDRRLLAGAILSVVLAVLIAGSQLLTPLRTIVKAQSGLVDLFASFVGMIVTGTSIVVTINQLVLAQELGAFGDQRERMDESMAARREIEQEMNVDTSPAEPAAFLRSLAAAVERRVDELDATLDSRESEYDHVRSYTETLRTQAQKLQADLTGAEFGTFEVLWRALDFDYSGQIHRGRQLRAALDESDDELTDQLDDILDLLTSFGPVREHFKTLYFQWEFINLSRALLYISIPALTVTGLLIMFVDGSTFTGTTLGLDTLVVVTTGGFVVGISPFVVFLSYVLRIATVAKQTLAIGPFVLQTTDDGDATSRD